MGALAGPVGGVYEGGECRRDALAPDPAGLAADLVPPATEVVVAAPDSGVVSGSCGGARGSHPMPELAVASMEGRGGEGEVEVGGAGARVAAGAVDGGAGEIVRARVRPAPRCEFG